MNAEEPRRLREEDHKRRKIYGHSVFDRKKTKKYFPLCNLYTLFHSCFGSRLLLVFPEREDLYLEGDGRDDPAF